MKFGLQFFAATDLINVLHSGTPDSYAVNGITGEARNPNLIDNDLSPEIKDFYDTDLLKNYRNWQLAFLEAWKGQFKNMTDVEKWWALVLVNCRKDTSMNAWTLKQSIEKLNEILAEASVSTISQINQPRPPTTIHLQQIAESWAPMVQIYFFERVAAQLKAFELAADPVVADLASRYRTTIIDYIRQPRIYAFFGKDAPSRADLRVLKKRLNYLDNEREQLQEKANATPEEPDKYLEDEKQTPAGSNDQP